MVFLVKHWIVQLQHPPYFFLFTKVKIHLKGKIWWCGEDIWFGFMAYQPL